MTFSKMTVKGSLGFLAAGLLTIGASTSQAHVSINSGYAKLASNGVITFSVGHGCSMTGEDGLEITSDTISIEVHLPEEITSVRTMPSPEFGQATIVNDEATQLPIAVIWDKVEILPSDVGYYTLSIRTNPGGTDFSTLYFPVTQTCQYPDGTTQVTEWAALPSDEPVPEGEMEAPPAASLKLRPAVYPGWNKLTPASEIDVATYFSDAEIVWADGAAYSSNPTTTELIAAEGVEALVTVPAGTEIWAKF